jgi:hypothetical protein
MAPTTTQTRDVTTTVKYFLPDSKNVRYFSNGIEVNISEYEDTQVVIHDALPLRAQ